MQPDELDELVERLELVAKLNGVITEDEKNLLIIVKENVDKFKIAYVNAMKEGGIFTSEQKEELRTLWKNILLESSKQAIEDQVYSQEELRIIFNIFSVLIKNLD